MTQSTFSPQTIGQDIKDFNTLDPQRKLMVAGIVLILFVGSIFIGAYLSKGGSLGNKSDNGTVQVAPTKKPATELKIMANTSMKVGTSQVVTVELSSVPVTATDVVVSFDPDILTVADVQNGKVFPKVIQKKIDATNGTITFSASVDPANPNDIKTGTVLSFKVTAKKDAPSTLLQFAKDDTITAINGENTLGLTTGATIKVTK